MDADDAFVSNISRRTDVDTNGYLDVIAHGTPNGIQITHNGQHMTVDHRTASRLIIQMVITDRQLGYGLVIQVLWIMDLHRIWQIS